MKYIITMALAITLFCCGCVTDVKPLINFGALIGFVSLFVLILQTKHDKRYERR